MESATTFDLNHCLDQLSKTAAALVFGQDYRLFGAAVAHFSAYAERCGLFPQLNLRQIADMWYEANLEILKHQTRKKYFNSILHILSTAVSNGLLPATQNDICRILPMFDEPVNRSEHEQWLAYEAFSKWYQNRGQHTGDLSSNTFRLYGLFLASKRSSTAQRNYARLRSFWTMKMQRRFNPQITVPPFADGAKLRYGLSYSNWPVSMRTEFGAYASKVSGGAESLKADWVQVSKGTLDQYRYRIGQFLGYVDLFEARTLKDCTLVEILMDLELVGRHVEWHIANCSGGNEREYHAEFMRLCANILEVLGAAKDAVAQLRRDALSIVPVAAHDFEGLARPDFHTIAIAVEKALKDAMDLYTDWHVSGRPTADAGDVARAFNNALLFALISWRPLRSRNYCEMCLGRNVLRQTSGWKLIFGASETKTDMPINSEWPDLLVKPLEMFHRELRPIINIHDAPNLFLRQDGQPFTRSTLWDQMVNLGLRYLDVPSNPHAFRRWIVCGYLLENPGDIETCKCLLGHRFVATTLKYYAFVFSRIASRRAGQFVAATCPALSQVTAWRPLVP